MKLQTLAVLATLISIPVFAQSLPDEINHQPYLDRLQSIQGQIRVTQSQISGLNSDIAEARKFISDSQRYISQMQGEIQGLENQISQHRNAIPQIQREIQNRRSEISQNESDRQRLESQLQSLRNQESQVRSQLRPLEASLNVKKEAIRRMDQDLNQSQREESSAASKIQELSRRVQQIENDIASERSQQQSMQQELRQFEAKIAQIQNSINAEESSISSQQSNLRMEESKLSALNDRVRDYTNELNNLRAQNAPDDQIKRAELVLRASTSKRDETAQGLNTIRSQISQSQSRISQLKSQIENERRNQQSLPSRISQSESRERELASRRQLAQQEVSQANAQLSQAQRRSQALASQIAQAQNDLRGDENTVVRLQQNLNELNRQIDANRNAESNHRQRIAQLNQQMNELANDERQRTNAIPQLEATIRTNRASISSSEQEIRKAQAEESTMVGQLSNAQRNLSNLQSDENSTQNGYDSRLSLYNRYLNESRQIGESQVQDADKLGQQTGVAMAKSKSVSVGQSIGKELGSAEGKYWALVRGEIQGYPKGYKVGIVSTEDIQRGIKEGTQKGIEASQAYAQSQLKPKFFDGFYLEELKKPVPASQTKSMKIFNELRIIEAITAGIDPITSAELQSAREISSTLDSSISASSREVSQLNSKFQSLNQAQTVFETPSTIPYGKVDCNRVYKAVQIFKDACNSAYRAEFKDIYVDTAYSAFADNYPTQYVAEAKKTQPDAQVALYNTHFQNSYKTAERDGLLQGQLDIYNNTFAENYKVSYANELPGATSQAQNDAKEEVKVWVQQNASITLVGHDFTKKALRGGDEAKLLVDLKNLSPQDLKSSVLLKISSNANAEFAKTEYAVTKVPGAKQTRYEEITFKVPANVRSGEKIIVKVDAIIPGHKYQQTRTETLKIEKALAANPKVEVAANYDARPDIRSVLLRYKTHKLTYTLKPVIEDIADGYEVTMEPVDNKELINLKGSTVKTGPVKANEVKSFDYSYSFQKAAKDQKITLKVTVKYLGEVIQVSNVEITPKNF